MSALGRDKSMGFLQLGLGGRDAGCVWTPDFLKRFLLDEILQSLPVSLESGRRLFPGGSRSSLAR